MLGACRALHARLELSAGQKVQKAAATAIVTCTACQGRLVVQVNVLLVMGARPVVMVARLQYVPLEQLTKEIRVCYVRSAKLGHLVIHLVQVTARAVLMILIAHWDLVRVPRIALLGTRARPPASVARLQSVPREQPTEELKV